jgi:hypothetical protein
MHYDRKGDTADGFRDVCKLCRKEERESKTQAMVPVMREIEDQALDVLSKISTQTKGLSVPHMAELFEAMMEAFEGPAGLARHCLATFLASKPGGPVRQKILSDIIRLGQKTTETGMAQVAMDKLTTEELEELHARILTDMNTRSGGPGFRVPVKEQLIEFKQDD